MKSRQVSADRIVPVPVPFVVVVFCFSFCGGLQVLRGARFNTSSTKKLLLKLGLG